MFIKIRLLALACMLLFAACVPTRSGSVEIPGGVESNCARGEFGENEYVDLKVAVVEEWLDTSEDGEHPLAAVGLEFRDPAEGGQPEKIETAFMVMDAEYNQLSPILGGGRMVVRVRYAHDQDSMIKVTIYDKRGKVVRKFIDSKAEHIKKGAYRNELDVEDFDYGSYKVVFEATNFYGTRTATGHFSVGWQ